MSYNIPKWVKKIEESNFDIYGNANNPIIYRDDNVWVVENADEYFNTKLDALNYIKKNKKEIIKFYKEREIE